MADQKRPDWSLWANIPDAELWKLIVVSMDIEPDVGAHESLSGENQRNEYKKRLAISESCIHRSDLCVAQMPSVSQNRNIEYAIVETMEFGAFAKRLRFEIPDRFPFDPVEWGKWGRMDSVQVWQAILLALRRSPDGVDFDRPEESFDSSYFDLLTVVKSCFGKSLPVYWHQDPDAMMAFSSDERAVVFLPKFREWAESKGYALPDRFPRATKAPESKAPQAAPAMASPKPETIQDKAVPELSKNARETLLTIIAMLAGDEKLKNPASEARKLERKLENLGIDSPKYRMIFNHLKEAKEVLEKRAAKSEP